MLDPKVRPVIKKLKEKGYRTLYSCEGHPRDKRFRVGTIDLTSEPYIVVQDKTKIKKAFRKAGFKVGKWKKNKGFIIATGKLEDKNKLWKKVLKEINKL